MTTTPTTTPAAMPATFGPFEDFDELLVAAAVAADPLCGLADAVTTIVLPG